MSAMSDFTKRAAEALESLPEGMKEAAISYLREQGEKLRVLKHLVQEGIEDVEAGRVVEWNLDDVLKQTRALNAARARKEHEKLASSEVGARIEKIRIACGLGCQSAFGERLGVTPTRINNWATGRILFPVEFAVKLRELTGVTLDYIYCGDPSGLPLRLADTLSSLEPWEGQQARVSFAVGS
jgi:transcriptional regulator with XRE-family HTH domain